MVFTPCESRLRISADGMLRLTALFIAGLVLANTAGQLSKYILGHDQLRGLVPMFDLNTEANVPTWYSSSMLLLCAVALAVVAAVKHRQRDRFAWHWIFLAAFFLFGSLDEAVELHERAGRALRASLNLTGWFYHAWVFPWTAGLLVLAASFLRWFAHLPRVTRTQFLLAAAVFGGGALGVELVEGRYASVYGKETLVYATFVTIEESCEMIGLAVFLRALMVYAGTAIGPITIEFSAKRQSRSLESATRTV